MPIRQETAVPCSPPERIIAKGFRELAKTEHPDTGGTEQRFRELRDAKRQLDRMMEEVGEILKT